jgi:hypothetical protein
MRAAELDHPRGGTGQRHRCVVPAAVRVTALLVTVLLATVTPGVAAQEPRNHLYDKFQVGAAGNLLVYSTVVRADGNGGRIGSELSFENELGSARNQFQPSGYFRWRPGRKHELELGALRAVRGAERQTDSTFTYADSTFQAGVRVGSYLRTSQAGLAYRYFFTAQENKQFGVSVGLGIIALKADVNALAGTTSGGADTNRVEFTREAKFTAPTGSVGVNGRFRLGGGSWYLEPEARGLYAKFSNFKVYVAEGGLLARHFFSSSFGAELGYNLGFYKLNFAKEASGSGFLGIGFSGSVKYSVNAFRGGVVYAF